MVTWSDRIDRALTHKVGGALFLLAVLYVVFQSIFYWSGPLMDGIDLGFGWLGGVAEAALPDGVFRSLLVDGLIGGVGGRAGVPAADHDPVHVYRAAGRLRLHGSGGVHDGSHHACDGPERAGVYSTVVEFRLRRAGDHGGAGHRGSRRERFATIMLIPFMSCSARLPVYLVLIGALVPDLRYLGGIVRVPALVMLAMYLVGVVVAIPVAWLLKKTAFAGPPTGVHDGTAELQAPAVCARCGSGCTSRQGLHCAGAGPSSWS